MSRTTRADYLIVESGLTGAVIGRMLHNSMLLFDSEWALRYCVEGNPGVRFHESL